MLPASKNQYVKHCVEIHFVLTWAARSIPMTSYPDNNPALAAQRRRYLVKSADGRTRTPCTNLYVNFIRLNFQTAICVTLKRLRRKQTSAALVEKHVLLTLSSY